MFEIDFFFIDTELQARLVSKACSGTDISSDEDNCNIENNKLRKRTIKKTKQDQIIKKKKTEALFTLPIPPISAVSTSSYPKNPIALSKSSSSIGVVTKDFASKGKKHKLYILNTYVVCVIR